MHALHGPRYRGCMETGSEVDRLRLIYAEYNDRGWSKTKWAATNPGNQAIQQERQRKLRELLQGSGFLPLADKRILDVGCGTGEFLAAFQAWGARPQNLFGVDLLPDRIRRARQKFHEIAFQEANAEKLPFTDGFFDLVAVFTVFSSILDQQMACNVSEEISRVLRSGGAVLWYDFRMNNPFNEHVRGMSRDGVRHLFENYDSRLISVTLLPQLARRAGRAIGLLYPWLASVPFLRTHYLGVLIKP